MKRYQRVICHIAKRFGTGSGGTDAREGFPDYWMERAVTEWDLL